MVCPACMLAHLTPPFYPYSTPALSSRSVQVFDPLILPVLRCSVLAIAEEVPLTPPTKTALPPPRAVSLLRTAVARYLHSQPTMGPLVGGSGLQVRCL